jgi:hypothetical protein
MRIIPHFLIFFLFVSTVKSSAQVFTNLNLGLPGLQSACTAWADFDNDGDQDLILEGFSSTQAERGFIYRNDNGTMTLIDSSIIHVSNGSVNWSDYDHDGDLDLLINGQINGGGATELYRNDNSVFTPTHPPISHLIGIMRWIDFDHDGFPDIVGSGIEDSMFTVVSQLYRNNGNSTFSRVMTNLPPMTGSDIQVADYDNDSLPDIFITGRDINFNAITATFHNDGGGNFSMDTASFRQMWTGTAKFGDVDGDNDLDIFYNGVEDDITPYSLIYLNDGNSHFAEAITNLPGTGEPGFVDWSDIDHDGDLDVLLSGTYLMRNDGNGNFADISPWPSFSFFIPSMFVDFDNDGDDDIFNVNFFDNNESTIYRNELLNGINNINDENNFSIYPNPVHSEAKFLNNNSKDYSLMIFNLQGEEIKLQSLKNNTGFNLSFLSNGIYILQIKNSAGTYHLKFVKE